MATRSSILAWRIAWTEEPGRLQSERSQESDRMERLQTVSVSLGVISHAGGLPPGSWGWAWMMSVPEGRRWKDSRCEPSRRARVRPRRNRLKPVSLRWGRGGEGSGSMVGTARRPGVSGCTLQDTEVQLKDSGLHGRAMECQQSRAGTWAWDLERPYTAGRQSGGRGMETGWRFLWGPPCRRQRCRQKEMDLKTYVNSKK